jgi:uncharacterized protein (TIGR00251 family)
LNRPAPIAWLREEDAVVFSIHVTPRARRERVGGAHEGALRVAVTAPPADGAANAACAKALARALDVRPADVALDPSSKHRRKRVRIRGAPESLGARLEALATSAGTD